MLNNDYQLLIMKKVTFNDLEKQLNKAIDDLLALRAKEVEYYVFGLIHNVEVEKTISTRYIEYLNSRIKSIEKCIQLINEDNVQREEVLKNSSDLSFVEKYKKDSKAREDIIYKILTNPDYIINS